MKTKIILLIAISAVITLSFTFSTITRGAKPQVQKEAKVADNAPAGGFVSEDKF